MEDASDARYKMPPAISETSANLFKGVLSIIWFNFSLSAFNCFTSLVLVYVGPIELTLIPLDPHSLARDLVRFTSPPLEAW